MANDSPEEELSREQVDEFHIMLRIIKLYALGGPRACTLYVTQFDGIFMENPELCKAYPMLTILIQKISNEIIRESMLEAETKKVSDEKI